MNELDLSAIFKFELIDLSELESGKNEMDYLIGASGCGGDKGNCGTNCGCGGSGGSCG